VQAAPIFSEVEFLKPPPQARGEVMPGPEKGLSVSDLADTLATKHKLGDRDEILRRLRYFTTEQLLETIGSVHTGSGRKRLYPPSALIRAVVLLRLFQSGATVGVMKSYTTALEAFTLRAYKTKDLLKACEGLVRPTIFLVLPDQRYSRTRARLAEWDSALKTVKRNADFIIIQIARFL
jgi:hypothetical protein